MFCCFPFLRRSHPPPPPPTRSPPSDEKTHLVRIQPGHIRYETLFSIPYAHVLRDDKIPIESSTVDEIKSPAAYFLLNGTISDHDYETEELTCFSFDDTPVNTAVVLDTTTGHFLVERIYKIEHVAAINSSTDHEKHPLSSNSITMARPFDEFASGSSETGGGSDGNDNNKSN